MLGLMKGSADKRESPLFFGYRRLVSGTDGQALVEERYKLLHRATKKGGYELYDLLDDPAEKNNLIASKPEVVKRMKAVMAASDESCRLSRDGADYRY